MAASVVMDVPVPAGGRVVAVTGDSSYATGGYALALTGLSGAGGGASRVVGLNDGGAKIALWDAANLKVKIITASTGAEVANASDQSAATVKLLVY